MDELYHEIDAFCREHDMKPTRFGREAVNDPAFVSRLRDRKAILTTTVDRVRDFMAQYRPQAAPSPDAAPAVAA